MNDVVKTIVGVASGIAIAIAIVIGAFGLFRISVQLFPVLGAGGIPWRAWLIIFALPEAIFVYGTMLVWKNRRPMAVGILVSAIVFAVFAMHIVSRRIG
jgi:hypothetical protein